MIKKQIWHPDTCKCQIEQEFDYATDPATLVSETVIVACPAHTVGEHGKVKTENQGKNKLMGKLLDFVELVETNPQGETVLKGNVVNWSFDANRVLNVSIQGLTTQKKNQAQSWCDTNLGIGKVIIS